jgi:hypothetical protein
MRFLPDTRFFSPFILITGKWSIKYTKGADFDSMRSGVGLEQWVEHRIQ